MKCPFCEKEVSVFHPKSHLLPEWMYKPFYEKNKDKRKFYMLNMDEGRLNTHRSGFHKSFICSGCERIFSDDDNYASKVLTEDAPLSRERKAIKKRRFFIPIGKIQQECLNVSGLNYGKLKKFVLSVIIRTYLARGNKGSFLLTPEEYFRLKTFYFEEENYNDSIIPIWLTIFSKDKDRQYMMAPYISNSRNCKIVSFLGAGFLFDVLVKKDANEDGLGNLYGLRLKCDGTVNAPLVELEKTNYFQDMKSAAKKIGQTFEEARAKPKNPV